MLLKKIQKVALRPVLVVLGVIMMVLGMQGVAAYAGPGAAARASVTGVGSTATVAFSSTLDVDRHVTVTIDGVETEVITVVPGANGTKDYQVAYQKTLTLSSTDGAAIFPDTASYTNNTPPISGVIEAAPPGPATVTADGRHFIVAAADHWMAAANNTVLTPGVEYPGTGDVVISYTAQRGYGHVDENGNVIRSYTETVTLKAAPPVYDQNERHVLICHATGSESNPYEAKTISVIGVVSGHSGDTGDVWEAFDYVDVATGNTIHVPAQGDQSILAAGCKVTEPESPAPTDTSSPAPTETETPLPSEPAIPVPTQSSTPSSTPSSSSTTVAPVVPNGTASTQSSAAVVVNQNVASSDVPFADGAPSLRADTAAGASSPNYMPFVLLILAGLALVLAALPRWRRGQHL